MGKGFFHSPAFWAVIAIIAIVAFFNWFAFFAYVVYIGGDALGTVPEHNRFYVTSHGNETDVDEATWVQNLYYSYFSMMLFGIGFPCCCALILEIIKDASPEPKEEHLANWNLGISYKQFKKFSIGFGVFLGLVIMGATTRDFIKSLLAYGNL